VTGVQTCALPISFLRSFMVFALGLVLMSVGLGAQRGGGGRSGDMPGGRPETPTVFDSEELKIHLDAPEDARLYTVAAPGRYKSVLVNGKFLRVETSQDRFAVVEAKSSPKMSEADLKGYYDTLGKNPPQAKLQGFKMVSLKMIKIGKEKDKDAVEFVYNSTQEGAPKSYRQVAFVHAGTGFVFNCSTLEPQFGQAETYLFNPMFARLEFR
jgi:hypothetical protein